MDELTIRQEWLDAARKAGACRETFNRYHAGDPVSIVKTSDLMWYEENVEIDIDSPAADQGRWPIWALGHKHGIGDGNGAGYGSGFGDGSGCGCGYGYGYGSGYGCGDGDGYGYGYGRGDGDGDGRRDIVKGAIA